jgi:hypothetical protein
MSSKNTPNTLIIYIKTRVPNYYKITYEPSMSDPKTKSRNVFFNPLVKYYASIVNNPPVNSPPNTKITQFFELNQFESMINRILSDFRYMQRPKTLNEATSEKIIDNNIKITLNSLFGPNNILYLNKAPYTIIGYKWKIGSWVVDIKPIDKLINPYLPVLGNEIQNAEKELDEIPEEIRQGEASASSLISDFNKSALASGNMLNTNIKKDVSTPLIFSTDPNILKNMLTSFKNLYTKYLQKNDAFNFNNESDLARDPISLSFLISKQQLLDFFDTKTEESNKLLVIYNNYLNNKNALMSTENIFFELNSQIGLFKQDFNLFVRTIDKTADISKVNEYRTNYMNQLESIYQALVDVFNSEKILFISLVSLLEGIKENYDKIYIYYKRPDIAIKCIDLDIITYKSFINIDPENNNSVSYFDNIKRGNDVLNIIKNKSSDITSELSNVPISRRLLNIEKNQYDVYLLRSLLLYHYNQLDIWKTYYDSISPFVNEIATYTNSLLKETDDKLIKYNNTYDLDKQNEFIKFYKVDGIRLFIDKNGKKKWKLVNSNGERVIKKDKNIIKLSNKDFTIEKEYIDVVRSEINCYDMIVLYSYLLQIQCLRQSKVYTAEENVYQVEYEACISLKHYFESIKRYIEKKKSVINIPNSLMWDISNFDKIEFIESKIKTNYMAMTLYTNKISEIHKSADNLSKYCDELYNSLYPKIDDTFLYAECNKIISKNISNVPQYRTKSSYWLKKEIKNYDIRNSKDLNYYIDEIVKLAYNSFIINELEPEYYQDWAIYDNEGSGDCFFAALRDALNGQLDLLNAVSTNIYTDTINGEKRYTISSLRRIVVHNFTQDDYDSYSAILGAPDEKGEYDLSNEVIRQAYNLLYETEPQKPIPKKEPKWEFIFKKGDGDKWIDSFAKTGQVVTGILGMLGGNKYRRLRDLGEVQAIIAQPCTYWADELAIKYIQNTLKIGIIIFNMVPRNNNSYLIGDTIIHIDDGKKYTIIEKNYTNNNPFYTLQDKNDKIINNVSEDSIKIYEDNILSKFRIECQPFETDSDINHFIFIAKTSIEDGDGNQVLHYELVRNTGIGMYVYEFNQIPEYIKYFIYENCYRYLKPDIRNSFGFSQIKVFNEIFKKYDEVSEKEKGKIRGDSSSILEDPLIKEYDDVYLKLSEVSAALANLKTIENPDEIIIRDIESTQKQVDELQLQLNLITDKLFETFETKGGAAERPSEKYSNYTTPTHNYANNPYMQQNYYSLPRPTYPYMYQNPSVPYSNYVNKMKETSSKTAYYIDIELEVFPGKNITPAQKLEVKCQSAFENIREAYANLFGYEYRPSELRQDYTYRTKLEAEKRKKLEEQTRKYKNVISSTTRKRI